MRFLKFVTIAMGVLIVVATTVLLVVVARRLTTPATPAAPSMVAVLLDEPAGTRIAEIAPAGDRLAVHLQGGGADRIVLLDTHTGQVAGRIGVRPAP